ncbi:hypothetical protein Purlil1_1902 [Purpureocillium lilacinum]|uniref:Uncharacterized protein n=1 Tax=Purpureocillium lilacinum TaxID=33203 RepID=A0ABR0CAZ3_PURLI|nr:hypothetical protein Purlil1_1902 [Purpureocillium lilacinum]
MWLLTIRIPCCQRADKRPTDRVDRPTNTLSEGAYGHLADSPGGPPQLSREFSMEIALARGPAATSPARVSTREPDQPTASSATAAAVPPPRRAPPDTKERPTTPGSSPVSSGLGVGQRGARACGEETNDRWIVAQVVADARQTKRPPFERDEADRTSGAQYVVGSPFPNIPHPIPSRRASELHHRWSGRKQGQGMDAVGMGREPPAWAVGAVQLGSLPAPARQAGPCGAAGKRRWAGEPWVTVIHPPPPPPPPNSKPKWLLVAPESNQIPTDGAHLAAPSLLQARSTGHQDGSSPAPAQPGPAHLRSLASCRRRETRSGRQPSVQSTLFHAPAQQAHPSPFPSHNTIPSHPTTLSPSLPLLLLTLTSPPPAPREQAFLLQLFALPRISLSETFIYQSAVLAAAAQSSGRHRIIETKFCPSAQSGARSRSTPADSLPAAFIPTNPPSPTGFL